MYCVVSLLCIPSSNLVGSRISEKCKRTPQCQNVPLTRFFGTKTELLDAYTPDPASSVLADHRPTDENERSKIGFHNAHFRWSASSPRAGTATPSQREFTLKADGDIIFQPGGLNLVVGPTASGKTSLLLALLGELHYIPSVVIDDSWYNLPRDAGVSFCAQEPWILNETIKVTCLSI